MVFLKSFQSVKRAVYRSFLFLLILISRSGLDNMLNAFSQG